jgi:chromosome segregation protein
LKSLTLRGFKSFASATTLDFEPGITCVVGPNGSGKSNVVDAIAWVMGEQGVKSLRGGKMEDVIFAGTAGRAPLGRAEVALTIDNSDGALPIDYTEVTVTRTMFRNGGSDYAINGEGCRLLDVQELLSDSGIGREMHVIVGQGRLDAILHASPEDRRGFIEEAAGVLKHRKRKEKALRKLDAMQANLTRLTDLTTELRRQLKPLGRQAQLARRAQVIQADLRDARLRLLADDVTSLTDALAKEESDEARIRARQAEVEGALAAARAREAVVEEEVASEAPLQARAQDTYVALASVRERFAGLRSVAQERLRNAAGNADALPVGPDPESLQRQADEARAEDAQLREQVEAHRRQLAVASQARAAAEQALAAEESRLAALERAAADRREGLATLTGRVGAATSRLEARRSEIARLAAAREEALGRASAARGEYQALENRISGLDAGEQGLDASYEQAQATVDAVDDELLALREAQADAARRRTALEARVDALRMGLSRKDGAASLLAADAEVSGVLGSVAALVRVEHGYETAVATALGVMADAVAVSGVPAAADLLARLRQQQEGRAHLLLSTAGTPEEPWPDLPAGAVYAMDVVTAPTDLLPGLVRLLRRVAVVADLAAARELVDATGVTAVTKEGDLLGRDLASGGSDRAQSLLEVQSAHDEAEAELARVGHQLDRLAFDLAAVEGRREQARSVADAALERLHESDARLAAVAEKLGTLGSAVRSAQAEADRLAAAGQSAEQAAADDERNLNELRLRLSDADAEPQPDVAVSDRRADLRRASEAARAGEVDTRLALRTAEEREQTTAARVVELDGTARRVRSQREAVARRLARQRREAAVAREVLAALDLVDQRLSASVAAAQRAREEAELARSRRDQELRELRSGVRTLSAELDKLTDSVHRDELAKAEQRMRIDAALERAMSDFGVDADTLVAEYHPGVPVPPSAVPAADAQDEPEAPPPEPTPYVREQQQARFAKAEKELALLGRVNPLALEEFTAMQERQAFLGAQLADLKAGREDLLGIISDVDARVEQVFAEAYADVAAQFEGVFSRLFPGGEGRLTLTDPSNMLVTGVEVEARPAGKRVKRLSLLSGGERSLTAVAFLVALFKARPSPFYLLDEVEAALDDVNLGRLLDILEELRATSQLLVITHQKRTMEIGDALYGVTMRDGVTSVISQRLRESA